MNFTELINEKIFILIPVLFACGEALKYSKRIDNRYIPILLGVLGIALCALFKFITPVDNVAETIFFAVTQGILCAAGAVYGNEVIKQALKDKFADINKEKQEEQGEGIGTEQESGE